MILEAETRYQDNVTAPTVTLTIDAETCRTLWQAFSFMSTGFRAALTRYKGRRAFIEAEPQRKAHKAALKASMGLYVWGMAALPRGKLISAAAKEFEICYDTAALYVGEARREARAEAVRLRYAEIERLALQGLTAKAIAERVGLSIGTVNNILSKRRKTTAQRDTLTGEAA